MEMIVCTAPLTRSIDASPRLSACALAASSNRSEMIETEGTPRISRPKISRVWHVVHEPQSASASMAASHVAETSSKNSAGAGFVNVGLARRSIVADGYLLRPTPTSSNSLSVAKIRMQK